MSYYNIKDVIKGIEMLASEIDGATIMEVCGTHTTNIRKFGIPSILPENIKLVSGPGCPVCVTSEEDIADALSIADRKGVIFTSFGDMLRVPCGKESLYSLYEKGRDVRLVTSPMDALQIASENPKKQVIYFGIGFETTAPHTAALIDAAEKRGISNLSVLCSHKTMPGAIEYLLKDRSNISALLCPGHVAAVIGSDAFSFVPEKLNIPAAISGFEAYDILAAILRIVYAIRQGKPECVNMYPKVVMKDGNATALKLLHKVMEPCDAEWRGLGSIPNSGLKLRRGFADFDARNRFEITKAKPLEPKGCECSSILRGEHTPADCALFGKACTPDNPVGPCMVSSEGSCSAYFNYREA